MSTELSNGVIIPEEYSDDWYDEMSINLRKLNDVITAASDNATDIQRLDTDKANQSDLTALTSRVSQNETDITALQTAVSGALKREIVQTLPTEDISTTTIYMIRNSESSGTNIYDEYMYINSQWELIGTSATDFSNYYTKNETDNLLSGKVDNSTLGSYYTKTESDNLLSAKANQTDLTALSGRVTQTETDITALQTAVSGALKREIVQSLPTQDISTTTIYMIRNTTTSGDNIYDEYMYINNLWELIGTSATDFSNYYTKTEIDTLLSYKATDSDVVHKSGNETVSGEKTFNDLHIIGYGTQYKGSRNAYILPEFSAGYSGLAITTLGFPQTLKIGNFVLDVNNKPSLDTSKGYIQIATGENNGVNACRLESRNSTSSSLGTSSNRWSKIYGTEYYYGSNNVEFSTKFVTTDTNQTISGNKTFSDNLTIYNSDDTQTPKGLTIRNAQWVMGESGGTTISSIDFLDKNYSKPVSVTASKGLSGQSYLRFSVRTKDSQNNTYVEEIYYDIDTSGNVEFRSWHDNIISLGTYAYRWKDVQTKLINGVEPSSLSLPSGRSARIDISSYFTNTGTGDTNTYDVPANGYINLQLTDVVAVHCFSSTSNNLTHYCQTFSRASNGMIYVLFPVRKDDVFKSAWYTSTTVNVGGAFFIPCQGNI